MNLKIEIRDQSASMAEVWLVSETAEQCITTIEKTQTGWKNLLSGEEFTDETSILETIYEELIQEIKKTHENKSNQI